MAKPKKVLPILLSLVALAGIVLALEVTSTTHFLHKASSKDVSTDITNATPATNADRVDTETQKNIKPSSNTPNQQNTGKSSTTSSDLKSVNVEITTYTSTGVSVNGFVTGVVEDNGVCTLTATAASDGKVLTATHIGEANATNTTCGMTTINRSKFHSGTWTLVLSYKSATAEGSSDPLELTL